MLSTANVIGTYYLYNRAYSTVKRPPLFLKMPKKSITYA
jgi:hypothetical protein